MKDESFEDDMDNDNGENQPASGSTKMFVTTFAAVISIGLLVRYIMDDGDNADSNEKNTEQTQKKTEQEPLKADEHNKRDTAILITDGYIPKFPYQSPKDKAYMAKCYPSVLKYFEGLKTETGKKEYNARKQKMDKLLMQEKCQEYRKLWAVDQHHVCPPVVVYNKAFYSGILDYM